jgi:hypothetical protein
MGTQSSGTEVRNYHTCFSSEDFDFALHFFKPEVLTRVVME